MRRAPRNVLVGLALVGSIGAGALAWRLAPRTKVIWTDAGGISVAQEESVIRDVLWEPAQSPLIGLNTESDDYEPEISADGLTLFLVRGRAGENADLYVCRSEGSCWSEPAAVAALNSEADELGPELSLDGRLLYFYSNREGGMGGYDLWLSRRSESDWRDPVNLGPTVNSPFDDYGPALTPDANTLYFASNRPRDGEARPADHDAWVATLREDRRERDFDLYAAELTDAGPEPAAGLRELNTEFDEGTPAVSPYGDFLYFASNRPGGAGAFDLYRSRRVRTSQEAPVGLGGTVNTSANELDPELGLGGYGLHFSSDRVRRTDLSESPTQTDTEKQASVPVKRQDYDIYYSASREVFREVRSERASIDWLGLWRAIGPNLLLALLALLLLILMLVLMRDARRRQLSLLARCLLASLMAHLLLMLVFNAWQVGSAVAGALDGRGSVRVALVTSAVGGQITSQIRGDLTQIAVPIMGAPASNVRSEHASLVPVEPLAPVIVRQATADLQLDAPAESLMKTHEPQLDVGSAAPQRPATPSIVEPAVTERENVAIDLSIPAPSETTPHEEAPLQLPVQRHISATEPAAAAALTPALNSERIEISAGSASPIQSAGAAGRSLRIGGTVEDSRPVASGASPQLGEIGAVVATVSFAKADFELPRGEPGALQAEGEPTGEVAPRAIESLPGGAVVSVGVFASSALAAPAIYKGLPSSTSGASSLPTSNSSAWGGGAVSDAATTAFTQLSGPATAAVSDIPRSSTSTLDLDLGLPPEQLGPRNGSAEAAPSMPGSRPGPAIRAAMGEPFAYGGGSAPVSSIQVAPAPVAEGSAAGGTTVKHGLLDAAPRAMSGAEIAPEPSKLESSAELPTFEISLPSEGDGLLPPEIIGVIRGSTTDLSTGDAISGALIRLVLPDDQSVEVAADANGEYTLYVPPTPDFFALTASHGRYVPKSANIETALLSAEPMRVDFQLERRSDEVIALEAKPDVHHLGNDLFEGQINSQFQRDAEGQTFLIEFAVTADQLAAEYGRAEVILMARGVQCSHPLRINGRMISQRLDSSPEDGSFGEFVAEFDPAWLLEGENTFKIRAQSCRGDLDDFEFVNVQIRLTP
ncbi:MAG TPA: hypothetical protein VNT79_07005 [Phycisphaerae bacterium]|nr:hypothetical protein [Phycisphaerae bacterium]